MVIWIWLLTVLLMSAAVSLINAITRKQARAAEVGMPAERFSMYMPKALLWIGYADCSFWAAMIALMTTFPNDTAAWWVYVIFIGFMLLGIFLICYRYRWRIEIDGDSIVYTPELGEKRFFAFSDITKCRRAKNLSIEGYLVYVKGKRTLIMDDSMVGFNLFLECIHQHGIVLEEAWGKLRSRK